MHMNLSKESVKSLELEKVKDESDRNLYQLVAIGVYLLVIGNNFK